jgi:hypothetical protein
MLLYCCRHRSVNDDAVVHASRTVPRPGLQGAAVQAGPTAEATRLEAARHRHRPRRVGGRRQRLARRRGPRRPDALRSRPSPGRPARLNDARLRLLPDFLWHGAEAYGFRGAVWTCSRVARSSRRSSASATTPEARRRRGRRWSRSALDRSLHESSARIERRTLVALWGLQHVVSVRRRGGLIGSGQITSLRIRPWSKGRGPGTGS